MGAWGNGPFDNDDAADWLDDLPTDDPTHLGAAFAAVAGDGPVEAPEGAVALAAAELLAAMNGAPADDLPPEVRSFAAAAPPPEPGMVAAARAALDRVTGEESELAELWGETGEGTEWRARVADLRERLGSA